MAKEKRRKTYPLFVIIRSLIKFFYHKMEVVGAENLPKEASIIVGNHCQLNGPICSELYYPRKRRTWCAGQMMDLKEVPAYAFEDFWSFKPKWIQPFFKVLAYIIAPLSYIIFNNAHTIGVYHDTRIMGTFKKTIKCLDEGEDVIIFPEHNEKYNNVIYDFQKKYIDTAKLYHRRTGKELDFVPMYIAPRLKKIFIGKPIHFCAESPIEEERERITAYLMNEITEMARSLPKHTVVPYRNIPKKDYPLNIISEEINNEKTGS
ncbi:MAG: hypothetical protein E7623_07160 [Ruminococcaceae bacterium]|nr:hypothetical protein [Oscillospiraceae bacterium]